MQPLNQPGIFKAIPISWDLFSSQTSKSKAIDIEYRILAKMENGEWIDWSQYEATVSGREWIIKKNGQVNENAVQGLMKALGWVWDADDFKKGPPQVECQIDVELDEYTKRYKVAWLNPFGDTCTQDIDEFDAEFGSLLRAAVAGVSGPTPASANPAPPVTPPPIPDTTATPPPDDDDDPPF